MLYDAAYADGFSACAWDLRSCYRGNGFVFLGDERGQVMNKSDEEQEKLYGFAHPPERASFVKALIIGLTLAFLVNGAIWLGFYSWGKGVGYKVGYTDAWQTIKIKENWNAISTNNFQHIVCDDGDCSTY